MLDGERLFYWTKKKAEEKWVYVTREREGAPPRVLLDPNTWDPVEQLAGTWPSRDGKYLAYGVAHGGDENPVVQVMVVATGEVLPDRLRGWKQSVSSWLPDGSGFYYACKPREGEVPAGEHEYWHQTWLHRLGTDPAQDVKVFADDAEEGDLELGVGHRGRPLDGLRARPLQRERRLVQAHRQRRPADAPGHRHEGRVRRRLRWATPSSSPPTRTRRASWSTSPTRRTPAASTGASGCPSTRATGSTA